MRTRLHVPSISTVRLSEPGLGYALRLLLASATPVTIATVTVNMSLTMPPLPSVAVTVISDPPGPTSVRVSVVVAIVAVTTPSSADITENVSASVSGSVNVAERSISSVPKPSIRDRSEIPVAVGGLFTFTVNSSLTVLFPSPAVTMMTDSPPPTSVRVSMVVPGAIAAVTTSGELVDTEKVSISPTSGSVNVSASSMTWVAKPVSSDRSGIPVAVGGLFTFTVNSSVTVLLPSLAVTMMTDSPGPTSVMVSVVPPGAIAAVTTSGELVDTMSIRSSPSPSVNVSASSMTWVSKPISSDWLEIPGGQRQGKCH